MKETNFERLQVYQLAELLADRIWQCVAGWDHFSRSTVGNQFVRAADSVGANIAEGLGRGSTQDTRRFVRIARGSLYEVKHWLKRVESRKLLPDKELTAMSQLMAELLPKLNAYLASLSRTC